MSDSAGLVIGSPLGPSPIRLMLLGSGELGREVAIEAMRLGVEVVAVDRYAGAPAMQVAHRSHVLDMTDARSLRDVIELERPDLVVPEVEAIATLELQALEDEGFRVIPTARATRLTMDREGIRRLAAEELGLPTSRYRFAATVEDYDEAVKAIGLPCVVKPVMSSSGKGQSTVLVGDNPRSAWDYAQSAGRVSGQPVIVEGFVDFEYEITLLTIRHRDGTSFCAPIGHRQEAGDYRESWQPHPMSPKALARAQDIAAQVTAALGGHGLFGVELFVTSDDDVIFSEVSPRPHDTGMVTMATQRLSEFALHVRAVLGIPLRLEDTDLVTPGASAVILADQELDFPSYSGIADALRIPGVEVRIFGKPVAHPGRRMGVVIAAAADVEEAKSRVLEALALVSVG